MTNASRCLRNRIPDTIGLAVRLCLCVSRYTEVRELLQDQAYWGWFIPYDGCKQGDEYICKDNTTGAIDASANLYHDEEQTPGWTGGGNGGVCTLTKLTGHALL